MAKRVNKTKREIVSDMQLVTDANRRRALIKDILFPYLVELNESIGYSKIFLQAVSGLLEGVFEETRKTTTVGMMDDKVKAKLASIFTLSDPASKKEYDRYIALVDKLKDISIQDFSYAAELPRYIDGFTTKNHDKQPITNVDISGILG
jgi:hypothetical protein